MADTVGTSIGFDISELRNGITEANRLIRVNESQWRSDAAALGDWRKDAEGLQARNESLSATIEQQEKIVESTQKQHEAIVATFGEESAEAQKSQINLNRQTEALNKSKAEVEKNSKAIKTLSSEYKANSKTTKELKDDTEELEKKKKSETKAIHETEKALEKAKKQYGENSDEVKALRTQLEDQRKSLEDTTKALEDNSKALEDNSKKSKDAGKGFEGLKVAGGVAAGAIAAVGTAAMGAVAGMMGLAESTRESRAAFANFHNNAKMAGQDADKLEDKYKNVSAATGEADAAFEGMNMLMATGMDTKKIEDAADILTGASLKFTGLKFEGLAEGLQESLSVGEAVGPFAELIERSGHNLEDFNAGMANCTTEAEKQEYAMKWLSESGLAEVNASYQEHNKDLIAAREAEIDMQKAMNELGGIAEPLAGKIKGMAASFMLDLVPSVGGAVEAVKGIATGVAGSQEALEYNLGYMAGTIMRTMQNIGAMVAPVGKALIDSLLTGIIDNTPTLLGEATNLITSWTSKLGESIPDVVSVGVDVLGALVDSVFIVADNLLDAMPTVIGSVLEGLYNGATEVFNGAGELLNKIVEALPDLLAKLRENLPEIITTILEKVQEGAPKVLDGALTLLGNIVDAIPKVIVTLAQELPKIVSAILGAIVDAAPGLLKTAGEMFDKIKEAIPAAIGRLVKQLPTIGTAIVDGLSSIADDMLGIGKDLVEGLWKGINDAKDWILSKVKGFGDSILNGFKDFFGIHSPSTAMAEIGDYLDQGLAQGITDNEGKVLSSADKMANNLVNAVSASADVADKAGQAVALTFASGYEAALRGEANALLKTTDDVVLSAVNPKNSSSGSKAIANAGQQTGETFVDGFKGYKTQMMSQIGDILGSAISGIASGDFSFGDAFDSIGQMVIQGIVAGITASNPLLGACMNGVLGGLLNLTKNALGIHSPSTKFEYFGEMTGEGYKLGLQKSLGNAQDELNKYLSFTAPEVSTAGISAVSGASGVAQAPAGTVINFTQNNTSPKALSARDIYRQTNRATNLLMYGGARA